MMYACIYEVLLRPAILCLLAIWIFQQEQGNEFDDWVLYVLRIPKRREMVIQCVSLRIPPKILVALAIALKPRHVKVQW